MIKKVLYSYLFILMTTNITYASEQKQDEKIIRGECIDVKSERVIATINIMKKYTINKTLKTPFDDIKDIACFFKEFNNNDYRPIGFPKIIIDLPKEKNNINEKTFNEDIAESLNIKYDYIKNLLDKSNRKLNKNPTLKNFKPREKPNLEKLKEEKIEEEIDKTKILIYTNKVKELDLKNAESPSENYSLLFNENIKNNFSLKDEMFYKIKEISFTNHKENTWKVQVAALRLKKQAEKAKEDADKKFYEIFYQNSFLSEKNINGKTYNRILFGFFSKEEALNKCKKVKENNGNCFITK